MDLHGRWWFLEINEQGQFLWMDHANSAAGTLEKFCAFLTTPEGSTAALDERAHLCPSFSECLKFVEQTGRLSVPSTPTNDPFISHEPRRIVKNARWPQLIAGFFFIGMRKGEEASNPYLRSSRCSSVIRIPNRGYSRISICVLSRENVLPSSAPRAPANRLS